MRKIATPLIIAFVLALLSSFAKSNNHSGEFQSNTAVVVVK
jgi:hypothetical protein